MPSVRLSGVPTTVASVTLEERLAPVLGGKGELVAIEGIARDITDRKEAEARQRELETDFSAQKLESIGTPAR